MFINEVCKLTGLTKKSIEYYENHELLFPKTSENGYRQYGEKEINALKEISLLRKIGMGVSEIKVMLNSDDKLSFLLEHQSRIARQSNMLYAQRECVKHLINNGYDIESSVQYFKEQLDETRVIKDRLAEAFPGNYGLFVSYHFGRYLNEKIDTPEKEAAYGKILGFLDSLEDIPFPREIEEYMVEHSALWDENTIESIENDMSAAFKDHDSFIAQKREIIEMYLEHIKTDKYKLSPAYEMKRLIQEFQKASGYVDIFIENMKILSRGYAEYLEKLHKANDAFLRVYPEAASLLGYE